MNTLFPAVLFASLLGSTHCAGMCGAFVAFAVGLPSKDGASPQPSRWMLNAAYNIGRLLTYLALGIVAGGIGAAIDLGVGIIGVQRAAAGAAGATMIAIGAVAVLRHLGVAIPRVPLPAALARLSRAGHTRALKLSPVMRALAVGLLTTLLPCGWLYAFVIVAAGTGDSLHGATVMAVFWLGTLPMMAAIGLGVRAVVGPLGKRLPLLTSVILVVSGFWTMSARLLLPAPHSRSPLIMSRSSTPMDVTSHAGELCPICGVKGEDH